MPAADEWKNLVEMEMARAPAAISAQTYRGILFSSDSAPAVFGCSDGRDYVVKSVREPYHFRVLTNDRVVGFLAAATGAPVPPVALVDLPQNLADAVNVTNTGKKPMQSGLAHGSLYQPDISKSRENYRDAQRPHNRARFAMLAVLYGLAFVSGDHQFFYRDGDAAVCSVDHGHFFPSGPLWTVGTLSSAPVAAPDGSISSNCGLTPDELKAAAVPLRSLTDEAIARAVAAPPTAWNFTIDDRVAMAAYLEKRRDALLTTLNA